MDNVEQEYFKNGFRQNFLVSLDEVFKIEHIDISKKPTDSELRYMQMYIEGELTSDQVDNLIKKLNYNGEGEKIVCRMLYNGNNLSHSSKKSDLIRETCIPNCREYFVHE